MPDKVINMSEIVPHTIVCSPLNIIKQSGHANKLDCLVSNVHLAKKERCAGLRNAHELEDHQVMHFRGDGTLPATVVLRCFGLPQRLLLWAEIHCSRVSSRKARLYAASCLAEGLEVPMSLPAIFESRRSIP